MTHAQVYEKFKEHLPDQEKDVKVYFPNGRNSIRIRKENGLEYIFTINEPRFWKFETIDQFLSSMKGVAFNG